MSFQSPDTESASDRRLSQIDNKFYRALCRYEIGAILDGWLAGPVLADRDLISAKLLQSRQEGGISREDYLNGLRPDIIARANEDADHAGRLAVLEVSITFNQGDLENAARRAAIVSEVTGNQVAGFVVTHGTWPDEVDAAAEALGVAIIRHEDPDYPPDEDSPAQ